MSHHTTTLAEPFVRFLMLDLVARACGSRPARPLVEGGGLIAWLASVARTVCTPDKCGIRSNDNTALRVATAKAATKALVTLIRHKGSIYLGPRSRRRITCRHYRPFARQSSATTASMAKGTR